MTAPWYPSPNPGGNDRRLMRHVLRDWITAQGIGGLDIVRASREGPDRVRWDDVDLSDGQFHAQAAIAIPHDDEDRGAYTGPDDPGGKFVHYSVEIDLWHVGAEPDSWGASEDDYDRIVGALKDCIRGVGRDLGRPDVILQVGEWPRTAGIQHDAQDAISADGGILRRGTISFDISQYLPSPADQQ